MAAPIREFYKSSQKLNEDTLTRDSLFIQGPGSFETETCRKGSLDMKTTEAGPGWQDVFTSKIVLSVVRQSALFRHYY